MVGLSALWLPILLSAVIVFVVSSIIHIATPWHKGDYRKMADEDKAMDSLRPLALPPGDYMVPRPPSAQEMRSPDFVEKMNKGPVLVLTVMPSGPVQMTKSLVLWFLYPPWWDSSPHMSRAERCPSAHRKLAYSSSSGSLRSSATRSRCGRCRSGIAAPGERR